MRAVGRGVKAGGHIIGQAARGQGPGKSNSLKTTIQMPRLLNNNEKSSEAATGGVL